MADAEERAEVMVGVEVVQRTEGFLPAGPAAWRPGPPEVAAAQRVESLLAFLDATEGDPDFESAGDGADQSYPEDRCARFCVAPLEDAEDDDHCGCEHDGCEPNADGVPRLAFTEGRTTGETCGVYPQHSFC